MPPVSYEIRTDFNKWLPHELWEVSCAGERKVCSCLTQEFAEWVRDKRQKEARDG